MRQFLNQIPKRYYVLGAFCLTLMTLILVYRYAVTRTEASSLGQGIERYRQGETLTLDSADYTQMKGEWNLIEGLKAFDRGDYAEAELLLDEAIAVGSRDKAVGIYGRYYRNAIRILRQGLADQTQVGETLALLSDYPPLQEDTAFIWDVLMSFYEGTETDIVALAMLRGYLEETDGLSRQTRRILENRLAELYFFTDDILQAMKIFKENVLYWEENEPDTQELLAEQLTAERFLGDIHFNYQGYETAVEHYRRCMQISLDDKQKEAVLKYTAYLNIPSACFELGDYEKVRESVDGMQAIFPVLDEKLAREMQIVGQDFLAQIAIEKADYATARKRIDFCKANLPPAGEEEIYALAERISFTEAKLLAAENRGREAIALLEEIERGENKNILVELGDDFAELLMSLYREEGRVADYFRINEALVQQNRERMENLESYYLEFGNYYGENAYLSDQNTLLAYTNNTVIVVSVVAVAALGMTLLLYRSVRQNSMIDPLTGLNNRKMLSRSIEYYGKRHPNLALGVLMVDVDHFKKYNDLYGHVQGDEALRQVAGVLKSGVKKSDTIIRYGGEEFLVLLEDISAQGAEEIARKMQEKLRQIAMTHGASPVSGYVTMSVGIACRQTEQPMELTAMIQKADAALFQAKTKGRNQICLSADCAE